MTDFFGGKNKAKVVFFLQPEFLSDSHLYSVPCNAYGSNKLTVNPGKKENFLKDFLARFDRLFPLLSDYKNGKHQLVKCLKMGTRAHKLNN